MERRTMLRMEVAGVGNVPLPIQITRPSKEDGSTTAVLNVIRIAEIAVKSSWNMRTFTTFHSK
jgi:hypothetical protein